MANNIDTDAVDDELPADGERKVIATDLRVGAAGRITIPDEKRERYGIEYGDYVDAVLYVNDTEEADEA